MSIETIARIAPTVLIILSVVSAVVYGFAGDWRKVIYWLSAAALNASITY